MFPGLTAVFRAHSAGYGDDGPRVPAATSGSGEIAIEPQTAWIAEILVSGPDEPVPIRWSTSLKVSERGAAQCIARPPEMISIHQS